MMASAEVRWLSCRNPNAIMRTMCQEIHHTASTLEKEF